MVSLDTTPKVIYAGILCRWTSAFEKWCWTLSGGRHIEASVRRFDSFASQAPAGRRRDASPRKARVRKPGPWLDHPAIRLVRTASPATTPVGSCLRTTERPFHTADHGSSQ